jgi:hypothetical protein
MTGQIKNAIDRSRSHGEIVAVEIDGDCVDALGYLDQVCGDCFDYSADVVGGQEVLDVWGVGEDGPESDTAWRLTIREANQGDENGNG